MSSMECPKCGFGTRVAASRSPTSHPRHRNTGPARAADTAVGLYTEHWVGRDRRCKACNYRFFTVELPIVDLKKRGRATPE